MKCLAMLLRLFLLAGALYIGTVRAASCIDAAPPSSDWGHSGLLRDPRADTQSGFIAVMRDYTFSCEGTVSQWRVQWRLQGHRLSSSRTRKDKECQIFFNFHVLRPTSTCGIASIGNNSMTVEVASLTGSVQESTVFNVSKADRISVEAGDVVGIAVMLEGCSQGSRYELSIMESTNESALSEVYYRRQQLGVDPTVDSEYICDVSDERSNSRDSDMSTGRSRSSQSTRRGTTEPTGGMSSHRKTTRPGIPRPGIPRPGTPQSGTPQPDTPRPDTSQPDTPRPDTPRPSTPQPGTPHPEGDTDEGEDRSSTPRPSTRPEGDTDEGEDRRRTRYSSRYRNGSADEREERGRTRYSSRYSSHSRSRDPYTPHLEGDTHGREDRNETDIEHDGDTGEIESERTKAKKTRRVRSRDDREDTRHTRHTTGRNTDEREDTDRSHTRSKTPKTRRTKTKTKTTKSQTREDEEYQLYFGAPLIDAIIERDVIIAVSGMLNTTSSDLESRREGQQGSKESEIEHFMIPTSVAAAVGSLLLITAAIMVTACVCYHWRRQKVDTKQHQKPQHYTMNENMAYGVANTPCSTTNDRYTGQRTVDDGIHRNDVGHYHIIDGSVYEVPSVYTSATGEL